MKPETSSVSIKKIILSGLPSGSVSSVVNDVVTECYQRHLASSDTCVFLQTACDYILAYLDLGFSYMERRELFDQVLSAGGYDEGLIAGYQKHNTIIKLNKAQLQNILGKWSPSPNNSHTKAQAVDEIIGLVTAEAKGTYYYYTAKKDGSYSTLFCLQITDHTAILHDVIQNKYYQLAKE